MKRPVTSLCRRPGKKTACGAACPRCGNNSHPQGRSMVGKWSCRAKAARTRAQKQPRRGPGTVHRLRPRGSGGQWGCLVAESDLTGCPPRQRARSGAKTAPGGGRELCADCAHGGRAAMGGVWCREGTALGARRGRGHARAQKQPPAGAGGCLDAGYGRYLPRAIRVIWMHRVGSTARPRIMPS